MMQITHSKPVAHIYAFALVWLTFALAGFSIDSGRDVLIILLLSFLVSGIVFVISFVVRTVRKIVFGISSVFRKNDDLDKTPIPVFTNTGNAELDAVIQEGFTLICELQNASRKIKNKDIVRKTGEMIDISHKIIEKLKRQPQLFSSAKRFFNYYLPTTTKLVTNYSYMESQGVTGDNISKAMQKIENSLTTLVGAYKNQLDTLFSNTAMDIETDIDALEQILEQESLLKNHKFKGE